LVIVKDQVFVSSRDNEFLEEGAFTGTWYFNDTELTELHSLEASTTLMSVMKSTLHEVLCKVNYKQLINTKLFILQR